MKTERVLEPMPRFEWETVVRRVHMPFTVKGFALLLSTYATTRTGEDVRPGNARLMRVSGMSERSVNGALRKLRELGLIECVAEGRSRGRNGGGLAAVYRLTVPSDLLTMPMLGPDEQHIDAGHHLGLVNNPQPSADESDNNDPQVSPYHPQVPVNEAQYEAESTAAVCTPPTHLTPLHLEPLHPSPKSLPTRDGDEDQSEEANRQRQMAELQKKIDEYEAMKLMTSTEAVKAGWW